MSSEPLSPSFSRRIPPDDDRERAVCDHCAFVDYENPKIVVGSVAVAPDGRVLMCKRAIAPRKGFWTLPAGFLEVRETPEEGAAREAREEACATLAIDAVMAVYTVPRISQVQIFYRARLDSAVVAGPESEEVALYAWDEIPWGEAAFQTVVWALEDWRAGHGAGGKGPAQRTVRD